MSIFILDGKQMTTKEEAYHYLKKELRLSDYFGNNLDALADELSTFDENSIIILQNSFHMLDGLDKYGLKMLRVFEEGAKEDNSYIFIKK